MTVRMQTHYPQDGKVHLTIDGAKGKAVFVRIPGWCSDYTFSLPCRVQNGYAVFSAATDDFVLDTGLGALDDNAGTEHPRIVCTVVRCQRPHRQGQRVLLLILFSSTCYLPERILLR